MAYLECRGLRKDYKEFSLDVSFNVEKGELVSIIGPSGSGKSTLLSLIAGIDNPSSGSIILAGQDLTKVSIQKRNIGMVFQDFSLFPSMDVAHNIQYGMKGLSPDQMKTRTEELLDLVGLSGYGKRKVFELSGGEAQRIALARSIAAKPQILLLDEPLSALDAPLRKRLRTTIRSIHDATGITMLYVTHDREEAFAISDRITIMKAGRIEATGTPEELYRHPQSLFAAFFTGDGSSIPVALITGDSSTDSYFFRPENIKVSPSETTQKELVIEGVSVVSCEFSGAGYTVRMDYKGNPLTAFCSEKPASSTVRISVPMESVIELQGQTINN